MTGGHLVIVAAAAQLLGGELLDGLQHPEPGLPGGGRVAADKAGVDEPGQPVESLGVVTDRVDGAETEPATEHRQQPEQGALVVAEQRVAAVDGGAEGPMSVGGVRGVGDQHRQDRHHAGHEPGGVEDVQAGRGQLQGER